MDPESNDGTLKENLKLPEGEDDVELVRDLKEAFG